MSLDPLRTAIEADDLNAVQKFLSSEPAILERLKAPSFSPGPPPLATVRSESTARWLLDQGASLGQVSEWWNPGFYVYEKVNPQVGAYLIDQGADVSSHALSAMGLVDRLEERIRKDPKLVQEKGGDGCTPLHFARNTAIAQLLVEHGADLDARDDDHNSTPTQWLIGNREDVVRFLIEQGATADIFVASALGDLRRVQSVIDKDPGCVALRVGKEPDFPAIGYKGLGGTILQWTLGFNSYAHQYAAKRGHTHVFDALYAASDVTTKFLVSCVMANREEAKAILGAHPDLIRQLEDHDLQLLARYCWETNVDIEAVRLMLDLGFPLDHPETSHAYSPLHNAAWGGYGDLVDLLLERGAPVDLVDPTYHAVPLGFAIHCCCEDGRHPEGEYERVVGTLIDAGSPWDPTIYPTGHEKVDRAMKPRLKTRIDGAAMLGDGDAVQQFIDDGAGEEGLTLGLNGAAKGGHVDLCRSLLDRGAKPLACGVMEMTPLHKAVSGGWEDIVRLLLDRGADVNAKSKFGNTPLHTAAMAGARLSIVNELLNRGANATLNLKNQFGATPLILAENNDHAEIAKRLREWN